MNTQPQSICRHPYGDIVDRVLGNFELFKIINDYSTETISLFEVYHHNIQNDINKQEVLGRRVGQFDSMMEKVRVDNGRFLTPAVMESCQPIVDGYRRNIEEEMNDNDSIVNEVEDTAFAWMNYTEEYVVNIVSRCMKHIICWFLTKAGLADEFFDFGMSGVDDAMIYRPAHAKIPTILDTIIYLQCSFVWEDILFGTYTALQEAPYEEWLNVGIDLFKNADISNSRQAFFDIVNALREYVGMNRYLSIDEPYYIQSHQEHGLILYEALLLDQVRPGVWESIMESEDEHEYVVEVVANESEDSSIISSDSSSSSSSSSSSDDSDSSSSDGSNSSDGNSSNDEIRTSDSISY